MKRILVPTDFSKEAENALKVAAQLAKDNSSEIYLLHILDLSPHNLDALHDHNEDVPDPIYFMQLAHKKFEALIAQDYLSDLDVYETVSSDSLHEGVAKKCKEHDIDLVIMGSHGASGFREMFVGSNAEKVVRTSPAPVLVIKNEHHNFKIENLVFASDFKNDNKETYRQAAGMATVFNAKMHLVIINTPNRFITTQEANKRITEFTEGVAFHNYTTTVYNDETIENGILNFAKSIDADLIGISTHGRQGIAHFFNGSLSEDVVNHAKRPVMTFRI